MVITEKTKIKTNNLNCNGNAQKRMSEGLLGGMLKDRRAQIYQVGVGMGWVSLPDRGAAHGEAQMCDRAHLVWQVWSKGHSKEVVRHERHRPPIKGGKPRSHSTLSGGRWLLFLYSLSPSPLLTSIVPSTF